MSGLDAVARMIEELDWERSKMTEADFLPRRSWSFSQYGMTKEQILAIYEEQDRRCASCRKKIYLTIRGFHTDHDHDTGKFRGLLCKNCNLGIGLLGDNVESLKLALAYLERARDA